MISRVFLISLALVIVGCAKVNPVLIKTEDVVYQTLVDVDAKGDQLTGCVTPATAPQNDPCKLFNSVMAPALRSGATFNRAVRNQDIAAAADLLRHLADVAVAIDKAIVSPEKDRLLAEIRALVQIVSTVFGGAK